MADHKVNGIIPGWWQGEVRPLPIRKRGDSETHKEEGMSEHKERANGEVPPSKTYKTKVFYEGANEYKLILFQILFIELKIWETSETIVFSRICFNLFQFVLLF